MLDKVLKRFYKIVAVAPDGTDFAIHLDGRPVKTPAGKRLAVPSQALAEAMAEEWQAQGEQIRPSTMPLTQLASTALDRIGPERAVILDQLSRYAGTDLLCYRATSPSDLVARQQAAWQPLLDWAEDTIGARMVVTAGIVAIDQSADALAALAGRLAVYDLWRLTVAQAACAASGSLILALALAERRISAAQAFDLSQLDENFQIEQWGEDWEARQRRDGLRRDLDAAERLLSLV